MKIINFLWHFSTGGIGKCFLSYDKIGDVTPDLQVKSVCIILDNAPCDCQPLVEQGIEQIHIKGNSDFSWMKRIREIVNKETPDAFFCHGFNGPIMLYMFRKRYLLNTPMICTCHGVNLDPAKRANKYIGKLWMHIYRQKYVKKIICVEQFTPSKLWEEGINQNKIVTVYNGIEPTVVTSGVDLCSYKLDAPVIITASRMTRIKGVNYLIDALAVLKLRGIKFCYFCIGDGEEEMALKKQATEKGLNDKEIHFMGYQSNVPEWLAACDVFVLPSLEEFHSIAILEAMRAKKAIVATNIGGNPESLRADKDALMVPSKDVNALADALERVLTSSDLRENLATSAHARFMERFTIDVMKKNLAKEILTAL